MSEDRRVMGIESHHNESIPPHGPTAGETAGEVIRRLGEAIQTEFDLDPTFDLMYAQQDDTHANFSFTTGGMTCSFDVTITS